MISAAAGLAPEGDGRRRQSCLLGAGLVLLTLVAYLPVLRAGFIWDDDWHVTGNRTLRSLHGLWEMWFEFSRPGHLVLPQYYPLTHTTFWVEYHLWGLRPLGYHLDNVLLHAAGVLLLWRVLVRLRVPGAWLAAAVWAVHPVMVESVAWVTERKNVLSGVLYFSAFLAYFRFEAPEGGAREGAQAESGPAKRGVWYGVALMLFALALLAKTAICTWPCVVLLVFWWKRGRLAVRDVVRLLPFFAVAVAGGLVTTHAEVVTGGASGADWSHSPVERVLIAGRALWFYAGKVVWPARLEFNYSLWTIDAHQAWQWLFPAGALAALATLWALRGRVGRGPLVAALFFAGTLAPVLGFINVYMMRYSFVGDHLQYIASIGVIAGVVGALVTVARARPGALPAARVGGVVVLAVLASLTWVRAGVFESQETVWRDTLAKNPGSWLAHASLGEYYAGRGEAGRALAEAEAVTRMRPGDAKMRDRLAMYLAAVGRRAEARQEHERAIRLDPSDATLRYNYAQNLASWGETAAAETRYREAMELDPSMPMVRNNLGQILADRGEAAEARELFRAEIALDPDGTSARVNLANLMLRAGDVSAAERVLGELLEVDPDNAKGLNTLAIVLARRGDWAGAEMRLRRAIAVDPGLAESHNTLGGVLAMEGRLGEAVAEYREALRLKPDFPQARRNLEAALAAEGRPPAGGGPK
jgi:Flp pilus assembly protein TadD